VIRQTDLERLALQGAGPCVSLFLPTHRAGPEVQQAPIRLKNLLRQAIQDLQTDGVRAPTIKRLLAPLWRLVDDGLFWQYQSDGLALYSRPGWWRSFRVPLDLPELAVVGDRFHVSPLLRLLTGDGHFLVLAPQPQPDSVAGGNPRSAGRGRPARYPTRVQDALQGKEAQKQLQLYVADQGRRGCQGDLPRPRVRRRRPGGAGAAVPPEGRSGAGRGRGRRASPHGAGRRGAPGAALAPGHHLPAPGRQDSRREPRGVGPPRLARPGLGRHRAAVPPGPARGGSAVPPTGW